MSARAELRALRRLDSDRAVLARLPQGSGYGVFVQGDRRTRPAARLSEAQVKALASDGAIIEAREGAYALAAAGRARIARSQAAPEEAFLAQHAPIVDRAVVDEAGDLRAARGLDAAGLGRRLSKLRGPDHAPLLTAAEVDAAQRLRADWEAGQIGLVRGSDWTSPPRSQAGRGGGNAREGALSVGLDARARLDRALNHLSPPLRRVATALCIEERSLDAFERAQNWPPRSAKIALKMALSQLVAARQAPAAD